LIPTRFEKAAHSAEAKILCFLLSQMKKAARLRGLAFEVTCADF